jgi:hypothetical protein
MSCNTKRGCAACLTVYTLHACDELCGVHSTPQRRRSQHVVSCAGSKIAVLAKLMLMLPPSHCC